MKIPVVCRYQDNGDGGWSVYIYNNKDELIKDHPSSSEWKNIDGKFQEVKVELTKERIDQILNEYDPYNDGYISEDNIVIEIIDGVAKLAESISFSFGQ